MSAIDRPRLLARSAGCALHTRVAEQLRDAIVEGQLPPGSWLREVELATSLGVSRAPVREALRALERDGLVVAYPYRGVQVIDVDVLEAIELFTPLRITIETFAARRLCRRGFAGQRGAALETLRATIAQGDAAAARGERRAIVAADLAFHGAICASCDHAPTLQLWRLIEPRVQLIFRARYGDAAADRVDASMTMGERHRDIVAALEDVDVRRAVEILRTHIARGMTAAAAGLRRSRTAAASAVTP